MATVDHESDDWLERLSEAEYEAFSKSLDVDREYWWALRIGAALAVFLPIAISVTLYPFIRSSLTTALHRLGYAVFSLALIPVFYFTYERVMYWFYVRAERRQARLQGLIKQS